MLDTVLKHEDIHTHFKYEYISLQCKNFKCVHYTNIYSNLNGSIMKYWWNLDKCDLKCWFLIAIAVQPIPN